MGSAIGSRIDALYAQPLDGFIQARDALAAELRTEGDREGAARVKALRKPSVPAWAIDQLARARADDLAGLFTIGERLRAAQRALLAGDADPEQTRAIAAEEREAVRLLVEHAATILTDAGIQPSAAYRERIADTLYATASDDMVRDAVASGRLTNEARRVGFGAEPDLQLIKGTRSEPANVERRADAERRRRREQLAQKVALLDQDAAEAARAVREAERVHDEAARAAARARKAAAAVAERLEAARNALQDATDDERS